eukprot:110359-Ditylum_brightwellii.AAC.1
MATDRCNTHPAYGGTKQEILPLVSLPMTLEIIQWYIPSMGLCQQNCCPIHAWIHCTGTA